MKSKKDCESKIFSYFDEVLLIYIKYIFISYTLYLVSDDLLLVSDDLLQLGVIPQMVSVSAS